MTHDKSPPALPAIVDEAGNSPTWVPALGLGLLLLVAALVGVRMVQHDSAAVPAGSAEAAAEAPADAPGAVPTAEPAAEPR